MNALLRLCVTPDNSEQTQLRARAGDAGAVTVKANTLTIDGGTGSAPADNPLVITGIGTQAAFDHSGDAGLIRVQAEGDVVLKNMGTITSSARSSNGGLIDIISNSSIELFDSTINAQAGVDGGNIKLTAPQRVRLIRSELTARAGRNGAQIDIDPQFVIRSTAEPVVYPCWWPLIRRPFS